jgi:hypothetical protein
LFCQFPTVEHEVGNVNEVWYIIANFRLYKLLVEALSWQIHSDSVCRCQVKTASFLDNSTFYKVMKLILDIFL